MTLSKKLPAFFLFFGVLMLTTVAAVSWKGKEILQQTMMGSIGREASLLIHLIERNLVERYHDAKAFPHAMGSLKNRQLADFKKDAELTGRLNSFVHHYKVYRRIVIFDSQGNIIAASNKNRFGKPLDAISIEPAMIRQRDWFQAALQGESLTPDIPDGTYVTGPERGLLENPPLNYDMIFATQLKDSAGKVLGIWVNVVDFSTVESIVEEMYSLLSSRGFKSSELTILDKHGNILVDFDPVGQQKAKYNRDFSVLGQLNLAENGVEGARLAVSGLSGSNVSTHLRKQVDQVTGYAHSKGVYDYPGLGWSALIRVGVDEAFSTSEALARKSLYMALALLSVSLFLAVYFTRQMVKPLAHVSRVINRMAQGEKDVPIPSVQSHDEIGRMISSLDNLNRIVIERERLSVLSSEQQFKLDIQQRAIDSTATGIVVADVRQPGQPIIYVNRAFEELSGYQAGEVIGRNCSFLQGEDREQPEIEKIRFALKNQLSCSVVLRNYRRDGTLFYNNLHIDPVFNDDGELTHYIGVQTDITDIKHNQEQAKQKLEKEIARRTQQSRDSESRLRAVFDTALDGTVVVDDKGKIIDVNRSLEVIFGRIREEMIGENVAILMPEQYASQHDSFIEKYLVTGMKKLIGTPRKVMGQHKSGRVFPVEISIGETRLGDVQAFVGVVRDIQEQEAAKAREIKLQTALQEKEIIYRTAFNQAAIGIARMSLEGGILEVNDRMCAIMGYPEHELLLSNILDMTHPAYRRQTQNLLEGLIAGESTSFTIDKKYTRKDGSDFWATTSISVVNDDKGKPKYFIKVIEDISQRKDTEKELRDAKDARDGLLRGMKLASEAGGVSNWSWNVKTNELKWDDGMYRLYGIPKEKKLTYADWRNAIHPDDIENAVQQVKQAIENDDVLTAEFRIINAATGETKWIKAAGNIYTNSEDEKETLFGINLDVTEERVLQNKLERESAAAMQASEAKSRFLATMSHEIRTPMNGVIGMIDLLRESDLSIDQEKMVNTIRDSSFSLLEIINDILDFSKIESGQMELEYRSTNLLALIERTLEALWVTAREKNVSLLIEYDFQLPRLIKTDAVRLRQVLLNLVGNAIKFSYRPDKPAFVTVRASYHQDTKQFSLSVRDTGAGMTDEQVGRLFRPFTQADNSTTRKYGGTGLGLSITKSFIEMMKGNIDVISEVGKGSNFTITLPLKSPDKEINLLSNHHFSDWIFVIQSDRQHIFDSCEHTLSQLGPKAVYNQLPDGPMENSKYILITLDDPFDMENLYVRNVVIDTKISNRAGYIPPQLYYLGLSPLKPSELITAVSVLCGIESPDFSDIELFSQLPAPSNDEANDNIDKQDIVILCVEDQPTNRLVLGRQLSWLGYQYQMTENGKQALEAWRTGQYPLVLTDCHMPEMDGLQLTQEIRRIEAKEGLPHTCIIALTANALVGESDNCMSAGMDDYIAKPVELNKLKDIITRNIKHLPPAEGEAERNPESASSLTEGTHPALVDLDHLEKVIGTRDSNMVNTVLSVFWESLNNEITLLDEAITAKNTGKIRAIAHGLKGSASSSGVLILSNHFGDMEKNHADMKKVNAIYKDIKSLLGDLEAHLVTEQVINVQ